MFKLYRKSQEVQFNWIRNHPVQWIAVNTILAVGFIGYYEYMEHKKLRKCMNEIAEENQ